MVTAIRFVNTAVGKAYRICCQEGAGELIWQLVWRALAWLSAWPLALWAAAGPLGLIHKDLYATLVLMAQTQKIRRLIRSRERHAKVRGIESLDLARFKRSEKIFLLGSGASVNDLRPQDWAHIAQHDSLGWNSWHIHDFVPTYYFFEMSAPESRYDYDYKFLETLDKKKLEYTNTPFVCRYINLYNSPNAFDALPQEVKANLYLSAPYQLKGRTPHLVERQLAIWRTLVYDKPKKDMGALIHYRGSLSDAVVFSVLAGYQEIILIGVDMNNKLYFWEAEPEKYPLGQGMRNPQTGNVHNTANPDLTNSTQTLPLDQFLDIFDKVVLQSGGIQLFIGSHKSRLFPRFPLYTSFEVIPKLEI